MVNIRVYSWAETNPISSVVYPNKLIIGSNPPFVPRKGCVPQNLLLLVPNFLGGIWFGSNVSAHQHVMAQCCEEISPISG